MRVNSLTNRIMEKMHLDWLKTTTGQWANIRAVDLSSINTFGVYVIWTTATLMSPPRYIRIGQGNVRERIQQHLNTPEISLHNPLYFTCATVPHASIDGVERYLAEQLLPLVGERFPQAHPIPVNLPLVD